METKLKIPDVLGATLLKKGTHTHTRIYLCKDYECSVNHLHSHYKPWRPHILTVSK